VRKAGEQAGIFVCGASAAYKKVFKLNKIMRNMCKMYLFLSIYKVVQI
jgi:hypothetical protein